MPSRGQGDVTVLALRHVAEMLQSEPINALAVAAVTDFQQASGATHFDAAELVRFLLEELQAASERIEAGT